MPPVPPKAVLIAAISSDIGRALAIICRARGWEVIGTFRDAAQLGELADDPGVTLLPCDAMRPEQVDGVAAALGERGLGWDLFIAAVGQLAPIGPFFAAGRGDWLESVTLNGAAQLALLHAVYPFRRTRPHAQVGFLVGGAINRGFANYSAYSLGKLSLVKFCELIHDEDPEIHAVAVGTGWVATKIHRQTIAAADRAGDNLARTEEFLRRGDSGTTMADIMGCLDWCFAQDRAVTGGRNFSVVHDGWRDGGADLAAALRRDAEKFKLRRHANNPA
ncbi:MAG: SDR family oxidoreductase [Azospirillum sp.]|nr:SDR family oxidoreductase [Azospirillum sp.]